MAVTPFSKIKNNVATLLNVGAALGDANIQLVAGAGSLFPAPPFFVSCEFEVMQCTAKVADTLTVTRGVDGTNAAAHIGGSIVEMRGNAGLWTEVQAALNNVESGTNPVPFSPAVGSITSGMIADGTIVNADVSPVAAIAPNKLANYPWHNADLASDVGRANLLTNGGLELWQRGSGPYSAPGTFGPDKWIVQPTGTDTLSVTKATNAINLDIGSQFAASCVFVLGNGAGASLIYQNIPVANDGNQLNGRTLSLSIRVKTIVPNAVRVALNNYFGSTSHYTYSIFHSGGGTYETLTVTAAIDPTATIVQATIFFAASCTAFLDNAMLANGSVAADYIPLHPADDLARCLRYYEKLPHDEVAAFSIMSIATGAGQPCDGSLFFKVRKAAAPTITKVGVWGVLNCGQPSVITNSVDGFIAEIVSVAAGSFYVRPGVGAYYTVEANP